MCRLCVPKVVEVMPRLVRGCARKLCRRWWRLCWKCLEVVLKVVEVVLEVVEVVPKVLRSCAEGGGGYGGGCTECA